MAQQESLIIDQGADYFVDFRFVNRNLGGYTARMQFRKNIDAPTPLLSASTQDGRLQLSVEGADSRIMLHLPNSLTTAIEFKGEELEMVWGIELVSPTGLVERPLYGTATLTKEVVRNG
ncbi:hypothetical protein WG922_13605 [Ramlibacter sp. AN1015]|uniref:hypothetical protein n=1 Tax=Ramlibacter sp. AN1015 TaxID=3133428 RepID=UPI0030BDA404